MKGHLVFHGYAFEITGLALWGGKVRITASRPGPLPAMNGGVVTIFGEDGQGFGQSDASELVFRETGPYDQVVLNLGISVQALEEESQ